MLILAFAPLVVGARAASGDVDPGAPAAPAVEPAPGRAPGTAPGTAIEEVVVFGHPAVRRAEDLAQPFAVLSGEDLEQRLAPTLGETVAQEPGVQSASYGAGVGRPVIRGQDGARVRTLEDSLDALDASTVSGDHAVSIEPFTANQIEILKGPSTLLYGSGAIGGVVNVVTGRVPESLPDAPLAGRVEARGGGATDERTLSARLDGALGAFAWHLDGLRRATSDYAVAGDPRSRTHLRTLAAEHDGAVPAVARGTLGNSDTESSAWAGGGAWHGERGFLGASVARFRTEYGLPGSAEGDVRIDLDQTRYDMVAAIDDALPGIARLSTRVGITRYAHDELEPGGGVGTHFENDGRDARIVAEHAQVAGLDGALGLQFQHRAFSAEGEEAFVPSSDTRSAAVFIAEATDVGAVHLQFGARGERVDVDAHGQRGRRFDAFSVSLGGVWALADGQSVALQLDRSARAPAAEELYAHGPHLATGAFEVGDARLTKETARSVNLSYGLSLPRFELVASVYRSAFADFIYLADTGEHVGALPVRAQRQADATFNGLEFEATIHLHEGDESAVDLALFGDRVRARLDDGPGARDARLDDGPGARERARLGDEHARRDLPRIPPWRLGVALRGEWQQFAGELTCTYVARQDEVAAFETPTDGYTLLDASLTWHLPLGAAHVEAFARGSNLLDEEVRNHLSPIKDVAPSPRRGVVGGLRVAF